jgi:hypothetical protein
MGSILAARLAGTSAETAATAKTPITQAPVSTDHQQEQGQGHLRHHKKLAQRDAAAPGDRAGIHP